MEKWFTLFSLQENEHLALPFAAQRRAHSWMLWKLHNCRSSQTDKHTFRVIHETLADLNGRNSVNQYKSPLTLGDIVIIPLRGTEIFYFIVNIFSTAYLFFLHQMFEEFIRVPNRLVILKRKRYFFKSYSRHITRRTLIQLYTFFCTAFENRL